MSGRTIRSCFLRRDWGRESVALLVVGGRKSLYPWDSDVGLTLVDGGPWETCLSRQFISTGESLGKQEKCIMSTPLTPDHSFSERTPGCLPGSNRSEKTRSQSDPKIGSTLQLVSPYSPNVEFLTPTEPRRSSTLGFP